jgi:iron complex outermembrane receptor protein
MPFFEGQITVKSQLFLSLPLALLLTAPISLAAESTVHLSPLVVTGTRTPRRMFNTPTAISAVSRKEIRPGPPSTNLAESLARVPGVVAQNRQDYAQDLQISVRGFGSRAAFGVRGVRLLQDGIPFTTPGGSGATDILDIPDADRIEVLRGPFSALYGNSSGGVIQVITADGPPKPTFTVNAMYGSYGTYVAHAKAGGQTGGFNYLVDGWRFLTDGYREHSAARRDHVHAKFRYTLGENSSISLLFNELSTPYAFDPSGLTRAQMKENPRQAVARIFQFNTRKSIYHRQAGIVYKQQLDDRDSLRITPYFGSRDTIQYLPFSGGSGLSGGGIVDLNRDFFGVDMRFTRKMSLLDGPLTFTAGINYDRNDERRKGFANDNGVFGALRRNENDISHDFGEYIQGRWRFLPHASLTLGLRHSFVKFHTLDHFVTATNPNDSGAVSFSHYDPVAGLLYRVTPKIHVYANYGRGFETPTFAELAYRSGGVPGLNFDLQPDTSNNYEVGIKSRLAPGTRIDLALFNIDTRNEIVVDTAINGRTSYRNTGQTKRYGAGLSLDSNLGHGFDAFFSYSYLHAHFEGGGLDGNRLPAVPMSKIYAELDWAYKPLGFSTKLDGEYRSQIYVNDINSNAASGYTAFNWQAGFTQHRGPWRLHEYFRLNNLLDRSYVGAVIVNAGNDRFFEPAPGRNYIGGVSISYSL